MLLILSDVVTLLAILFLPKAWLKALIELQPLTGKPVGIPMGNEPFVFVATSALWHLAETPHMWHLLHHKRKAVVSMVKQNGSGGEKAVWHVYLVALAAMLFIDKVNYHTAGGSPLARIVRVKLVDQSVAVVFL